MDDSARVSTGPLPPLTLSDKYDVSGGASTSTTTPPSGAVAYRRGVSDPIADQSGVMARKPALADETDRELGMALTPPPSSTQTPGDVIIIHNLTSDQAKQLASDLAVKVLPAQIDLLPSTQPLALDAARPLTADSPLQVGESVRIIAHDDGLPGVEAMNESQTINADGSITLPLVGKMKAAGLTREQLAQKIPDAYRDAKSPTTATWVIDRLHADVPTTDSTLALTPTAAALATGAKAPTTAPGALAFDKDQQPASGSFGGGGGGGIGGRADGAVSNRQAANNQQGIDVTIRVVGESAATQPHTQTIVQPSAPIAAPAISPATTMPTTAPVP
jgi:hypothetical protein